MLTSQQSLKMDRTMFLSIIAVLVVLGLVFIYSASSIYALERFGSSLYFVKRQVIGLLLGLIGLIAIQFLPMQLVKQFSPLIFWGTLILTALTLIPGLSYHIHGSSRWLHIGGFAFQPSELLKIAFLLYIAYLLAKKENTTSLLHSYIPILVILGITSLVLLKQPDFGLTVTLIVTTFILLFIAHFKTKHLLMTFAAFVPAVIALIAFKPYRVKRILTFLNPWADPQGAGFQIIQSLIAIGSGGPWGVGIGHSKQKFFYLPMQHTDFIFSIIAEETGFFGSLLLITLFLLFLYFGLRLAWRMQSRYATFATIGYVLLVSLQALINLAVATGLVPTKGIGLPFVSYGNTGLVCSIWMLGIIIALSRETEI